MYPVTETVGHGTVPAFLSKLWTLVEDPNYNHLIRWDETGQSFHVYEQAQFAKEVLPLYFKHSNIASFIRQLNMYGFRKVLNVDQGGLKSEKDDLEFQHPYFLRGEEHLLEHIKRKVHKPYDMVSLTPVDAMKVKSEDISKVLTDVTSLRGKQDHMNVKIDNMKRENEALWREVANLRQKHSKQQQIINKLIGFLVTLVGGSHRAGLKRKMPLMLPDASQVAAKSPKFSKDYSIDETPTEYNIDSPQSSSSPTSSGPIIHDVTDFLNMSEVDNGAPSNSNISSPTITITPQSTDQSSSTSNSAPVSVQSVPCIQVPDSPVRSRSTTPIKSRSATPTPNPQPNTNSLPRFSDPSFYKTESLPPHHPVPPEMCLEMSNHLEDIQMDINNLKDILGSPTYNLDPNLLMGLFDVDSPLSPLGTNETKDHASPSTSSLQVPEQPVGNELVQYTPLDDVPSLLDLADDSDNLLPNSSDVLGSTQPFIDFDMVLNTPMPAEDNSEFKLNLPDPGVSADDLD